MSTDWDYFSKARYATIKVYKAVKDGKLERPTVCQLCGSVCESVDYVGRFGPCKRARIFAHHHNGYDHPLDVWWICYRCNARLNGRQFHNGTVTMEQARLLIASPRPPRPRKTRNVKCKCTYGSSGLGCGNWAQIGSDYCHRHQPKAS